MHTRKRLFSLLPKGESHLQKTHRSSSISSFVRRCVGIMAALAASFAFSGSLPDGFLPVEYVEATGVQSIKTNFKPDENSAIEFDFRPTIKSGTYAYFGSNYNGGQWLFILRNSFMFYGSGIDIVGNAKVFANDRYLATMNANKDGQIHILNKYTMDEFSKSDSNFNCNGSNFFIFSCSGNGYGAKCAVYSMKVYDVRNPEESVLTHDLVPCVRMEDNVAGLYDTIDEYFYTDDNGTSPFLRGKFLANAIEITTDSDEVDVLPQVGEWSGYGAQMLVPQEPMTVTMPETTFQGEGVFATLRGWRLIIKKANGQEVTLTNTEENKAVCTFTPSNYDLATLTWLWDVSYSLVLSADEGLTFTDDPGSFSGAAMISVEGDDFLYWEGDYSKGEKFSRTIAMVADSAKHLTAKKVRQMLYVKPDGSDAANGMTWETAKATIQAAIDVVATSGLATRICVQGGKYFVTESITVAENMATPFVIQGGFGGSETVVARDAETEQCIPFVFSGACVAFDSITVSNGFSTVTTDKTYGNGVRLMNGCIFAAYNSRFVQNGSGIMIHDRYIYGAGVGANQGEILLEGCEFVGNRIEGTDKNHKGHGGAVGVNDATAVVIRGCSFVDNFVQTIHARDTGGGAVYLGNCQKIELESCTFDGNYARRSMGSGNYSNNQPNYGPWGGSLYIEDAVDVVTIKDCQFTGSWVNYICPDESPLWLEGGTIFLRNTSADVSGCVLYDNGHTPYTSGETYNYAGGGFDFVGKLSVPPKITISNTLFSSAFSGWSLGNDNCECKVVNCTFAGNLGNGQNDSAAYHQRGTFASADFQNCIFHNNKDGNYKWEQGMLPRFTYCAFDTFEEGAGNIVADPFFADSVYCHPMSAAGSYKGGWFDGGEWSADEVTSVTIDAGNKSVLVGDEPQPNLNRVNMGYDGGTCVASKSVCGSVPAVDEAILQVLAYDALALYEDSALIGAHVASLGGGNAATVTIAWGNSDKGDTLAAWGANVAVLEGTFGEWETIEYTIPAIDCDAYGKVYYRVFAENNRGIVCSDPVRHFMAAEVPNIAYAEPVLSYVRRTTANVVAVLAETETPTKMWVNVWEAGGDAVEAMQWLADYGNDLFGGTYPMTVHGLTADTDYYYTVTAQNAAGTVTLETGSFKTLRDDEMISVYVAPESRGVGDGSSASNATSDIVAALDALQFAGDEIRFVEGDFPLITTIAIQSLQGVVLRGGYDTSDAQVGRTTLYPKNNASFRLIEGLVSSITLDSLSFTNANSGISGAHFGNAVYLKNCDSIITNCIFSDNGKKLEIDYEVHGGAVGVEGGNVTILDCIFQKNAIQSGGQNVRPHGGAVGVKGDGSSSRVEIRGSVFDSNFTQQVHARYYGGGAVGIQNCAEVVISDCLFTNNFARSGGNPFEGGTYGNHQRDYGPYGGAIYFRTCGKIEISAGKFVDCWGGGWDNERRYGWGGVIYAKDSILEMDRCEIRRGGYSGYAYSTQSGNVYNVASGSIDIAGSGSVLTIANTLFADAQNGPIIGNNGAKVDVVNCTIAGAKGIGRHTSAAYTQYRGIGATFRNCIIWGNNYQDGIVYQPEDADFGAAVVFDHCVVQEEGLADVEKNVVCADPKFVGSAEGNYRFGKYSPCKNRGLPLDYVPGDLDLDGNARRSGIAVDMGCYEKPDNATKFILR